MRAVVVAIQLLYTSKVNRCFIRTMKNFTLSFRRYWDFFVSVKFLNVLYVKSSKCGKRWVKNFTLSFRRDWDFFVSVKFLNVLCVKSSKCGKRWVKNFTLGFFIQLIWPDVMKKNFIKFNNDFTNGSLECFSKRQPCKQQRQTYHKNFTSRLAFVLRLSLMNAISSSTIFLSAIFFCKHSWI